MSATIGVSAPAHTIRRKTVYSRESGLNGAENRHSGEETDQNGFADS